jgi:hypothetical protein
MFFLERAALIRVMVASIHECNGNVPQMISANSRFVSGHFFRSLSCHLFIHTGGNERRVGLPIISAISFFFLYIVLNAVRLDSLIPP